MQETFILDNMTKKVFSINIHSIVDIITNSSSELFVCNKNTTLEAVQEMLNKIVEGYNTIYGTSHSVEDLFEPPVVFSYKEHKKRWQESGQQGYYYVIPSYALDGKSGETFNGRIIRDYDGHVMFSTAGDDNHVPWDLIEIVQNRLGACAIHY